MARGLEGGGEVTDHLDDDPVDELVVVPTVLEAKIGELLHNLHVRELLEGGLEEVGGLEG